MSFFEQEKVFHCDDLMVHLRPHMKLSLAGWGCVAMAGVLAGCSKPAPPPPPPPPSVPLVSAAEKSAHFEAVNKHLELGGTLYGYVDLEGDAQRGARFGQALLDHAIADSKAPEAARKVNLEHIVRELGLEDIQAF